eukprot:395063-Rhodomonas_salina.3
MQIPNIATALTRMMAMTMRATSHACGKRRSVGLRGHIDHKVINDYVSDALTVPWEAAAASVPEMKARTRSTPGLAEGRIAQSCAHARKEESQNEEQT